MSAEFTRHQPLPDNVHLIPDDAECVFQGKLFDVYQWQQEMFDGSYQTFEMLRRPDATLVIAINDGQIVVLDEQQPGYPAMYDSLPGGRIEFGESPLDGAKREMLEETGMQFAHWSLLQVSQPAVKIEWFVYVYVASGMISETATQHEVGEKITIKRVPFETLKSAHDNYVTALRGIDTIEELLQKVNLT